jgi:hypothetical protein
MGYREFPGYDCGDMNFSSRPGRCRRAALWIGFPIVVLLCRVVTAAGPAQVPTRAGDFVTAVPIDHLIQNPANLFDLQGKTLRFTPAEDGSYRVQSLPESVAVHCNRTLEDKAAAGPWYSKGWSVAIPFAFPFGGKSWDRVFVNMDGNISFEKPESDYWPDRNPWPDAGMYSVASAIDSRSAAGFEKMIAVFWGPYQNPSVSQISILLQPDRLIITWNMTRAAWGQAVLGVNTFQARLYASGVIEFTYPHVAERDGIVGLFPGREVSGNQLSHWEFKGKAPHPAVEIESADVYDAGTVLDLAITMKQDALTSVDFGTLDYRCWLDHDGVKDMVSVSISDQPRMSCWLVASPRTGGWRISGRRVDMFISKIPLAGCQQCSVSWDVTWWGKPGRFAGSNNQPAFDMSGIAPAAIKLSTANEIHSGNIFEVFHYPVVTKASERLLQKIYQQSAPKDDIAVVFTDFRIDDLYGQGGGAIAANVGIQGIGKENEKPRSTKEIGSTQLQMSIATVWLGSPLFADSGIDDGKRWFNFAHGVKWIAHECTHRWGMNLSFINPVTGKPEKLTDSVGHWLAGLDTQAMFSVNDLFMDRPGIGGSVMGGYAWVRNSDGTFSPTDFSFQVPGGYSALDLYVMGLLPPEKVPPTSVLEDFKDLGSNRFSGTKMPVKIGDIVTAMGPRIPTNAEAQKVFHMSFYVVHEPGREADPAMMARARRLSAAVAIYFQRATGGTMKVVASGS